MTGEPPPVATGGLAPAWPVLETARLRLRRLTEDDAPFILALLNDGDFVRFIGDRGVRTLDDARDYVRHGPVASYERFGFGLFLAEVRAHGADATEQPAGICGLLQRDALDDVDVGFAFLPAFRGQGYAFEAARAVMAWGRERFGLVRIVAIVQPDNTASVRLLEKLGLQRERSVRLADGAPELDLFA